jgi:hypothetical protein
VRLPAVLVVLGTLLLPAPVVLAAGTVAPPGQSAIDEYLETVPTAGGGTGADKAPASGGPAAAKVIPAKALKRLQASGADGEAAAALAGATAPPTPAKKRSSSPSSDIAPSDVSESRGSGAASVTGSSDGLPTVVAKAVTGSGGGLGVGLPLLLVGIALGAAATSLLRRRGGGGAAG